MTDHYDLYPEQAEPADSERRRPAIITLNGRRWLLGMAWSTYDAVLSREELVEEAESLKADWIAQRVGDEVVQTGYCEAVTSGWPRKIYSLSALLADSYKVPWAGAFDLGDGRWWYIAVRDNYTIMDDGDIEGSYADIVRARQEHASIEDFRHVDGTRADLEKLISDSQGRRTAIESLSSSRFSRTQLIAAALVVLAIGIVVGGLLYWKHVEAVRAVSARIAKQKAELARLHQPQQPQSEDLSTVLRSQADPMLWLAACQRVIDRVEPWNKGWQLAGQICSDQQLRVSWRRRLSATIAYRPEGTLDVDGNGVTSMYALPLSGVQGTAMALPLADARERVILWGQEHNIVVSITGNNEAEAKVQAQQGAMSQLPGQKPPEQIKKVTIVFVVPTAPFALDLTELTGFRLTELKHVPSNSDPDPKQVAEATWQFTGVLYGR